MPRIVSGGHPMYQYDSGGGAPYVAQAVQFDGDIYLSTESLTATDSGVASGVYWLYLPANQPMNLWYVDPNGDASTYQIVQSGDFKLQTEFADAGASFFARSDASAVSTGTWHCIIWTAKTDLGIGSKIIKVYDGDTDISAAVNDYGTGNFNIGFNGLPFYFGAWDMGAIIPAFYAADVRIMPNVSLLTGNSISEATRRLFIDADGKPVDPAIATTAFGIPAILFSGDASTFPTNQGTGGAFTLTGTLTNASTSPSD